MADALQKTATEIKFGDPASRIAQTEHWTVLLRPKQPTLGSLVLICREPVRSFAEVSPSAYAEMRDVVRRIEEQGAVVDTSTPEQLALTVKQELAKWKGVVLKAQLTPD